MKEVLCIKKPGFFFDSGARYGPVYNEVCQVIGQQNGFTMNGQLWYPQVVYYKLQGYDKTYPDCCDGFPLFPAEYFVDLISEEALAEEISETYFVNYPPTP